MAKYINPFTDWEFKRIFGQEFSRDLLISFLNDLFEGELSVKNVTFKDKEQIPSSKDIRGVSFSDKLRFIYLSLPFTLCNAFMVNGAYYDASGRWVDASYLGLAIGNGKKVLMR